MKNNKVSIYILNTKLVKNNLEKVLSVLSERDKEKANKYKQQKDYFLSLAGSFLVEKYTPKAEIKFNEFGKPYKPGIEYNISHSGNYAVLAVGNNPVGIDIEKERKYNQKLLGKIFCEKEIEEIKNSQDYFAMWTRKESLLKSNGIGIDKHLYKISCLPKDKKVFVGETYFCKTMSFDGHIMSVTVKSNTDFSASVEFVNI